MDVVSGHLAPFGGKVETVYFDSRLTYHIDCLMMLIDEGVIGLPAWARTVCGSPCPSGIILIAIALGVMARGLQGFLPGLAEEA